MPGTVGLLFSEIAAHPYLVMYLFQHGRFWMVGSILTVPGIISSEYGEADEDAGVAGQGWGGGGAVVVRAATPAAAVRAQGAHGWLVVWLAGS